MQVINKILGSELEIGTELTEAQMELLCGGAEEAEEDDEDYEDYESEDYGNSEDNEDESYAEEEEYYG